MMIDGIGCRAHIKEAYLPAEAIRRTILPRRLPALFMNVSAAIADPRLSRVATARFRDEPS
jgi:hypothetical protein